MTEEIERVSVVSKRSDHDVATELTLKYMDISKQKDVDKIIEAFNKFFEASVDAYENAVRE